MLHIDRSSVNSIQIQILYLKYDIQKRFMFIYSQNCYMLQNGWFMKSSENIFKFLQVMVQMMKIYTVLFYNLCNTDDTDDKEQMMKFLIYDDTTPATNKYIC